MQKKGCSRACSRVAWALLCVAEADRNDLSRRVRPLPLHWNCSSHLLCFITHAFRHPTARGAQPQPGQRAVPHHSGGGQAGHVRREVSGAAGQGFVRRPVSAGARARARGHCKTPFRHCLPAEEVTPFRHGMQDVRSSLSLRVPVLVTQLRSRRTPDPSPARRFPTAQLYSSLNPAAVPRSRPSTTTGTLAAASSGRASTNELHLSSRPATAVGAGAGAGGMPLPAPLEGTSAAAVGLPGGEDGPRRKLRRQDYGEWEWPPGRGSAARFDVLWQTGWVMKRRVVGQMRHWLEKHVPHFSSSLPWYTLYNAECVAEENHYGVPVLRPL